ncbi:MAG: AAA family ATPase [Armatimonadota bacterium]
MPMPPPVLYLLCGLSFAGKSTLARALSGPLDAVIVEADFYIARVEREMPHAGKFESWKAIQSLARGAAREHLAAGRSVLFDDLMVDPRNRVAMAELADAAGAGFLAIYVDTPVDTIRERQRRSSSRPEKRAAWEAHTQLLLGQLVPPPADEAVCVLPTDTPEGILAAILYRLGPARSAKP